MPVTSKIIVITIQFSKSSKKVLKKFSSKKKSVTYGMT